MIMLHHIIWLYAQTLSAWRSPTPSRQDGEPQTRGAKTSVVETEVEHQNLSTPSEIPEADLVVWLEQQKRVSGTGVRRGPGNW